MSKSGIVLVIFAGIIAAIAVVYFVVFPRAKNEKESVGAPDVQIQTVSGPVRESSSLVDIPGNETMSAPIADSSPVDQGAHIAVIPSGTYDFGTGLSLVVQTPDQMTVTTNAPLPGYINPAVLLQNPQEQQKWNKAVVMQILAQGYNFQGGQIAEGATNDHPAYYYSDNPIAHVRGQQMTAFGMMDTGSWRDVVQVRQADIDARYSYVDSMLASLGDVWA